MLTDTLKMEGRVLVQVYRNSKLVQEFRQKNMILYNGIREFLQSIAERRSFNVNYICVGSQGDIPSSVNTQLATEVGRAPLVSTVYRESDNSVTYGSYFSVDGVQEGTFLEAGLVVNGSGMINTGILFSRTLLNTPIVKTNDTAFSVTWSLSFS